MRCLFNSDLGACAPPQAPKKKCIFGFLGGIASGLFNYASTENTNLANRDIAWETNWANRKINEEQLTAQRENWKREQQNFEQQRKWNLEDRDYENWYNLPSNVRDRYLQAGINPVLAMQGSAGVASAGASTKQANAPSFSAPASAIPMQAYREIPADFSSIGSGFSDLDKYIQLSKENERADRALENDVQVSHMNAFTNFLNALTKAEEAGVNKEWINFQKERALDRYWLDVDQHSVEKEDREATRQIESRFNDIRAFEATTQRLAVNSNIELNQASILRIAQEVEESKARIIDMKTKGYSQQEIDAYVAEREKSLAEIAKVEAAKVSRRNKNHPMNVWSDFAGGLLDPLKGLISVGGKL